MGRKLLFTISKYLFSIQICKICKLENDDVINSTKFWFNIKKKYLDQFASEINLPDGFQCMTLTILFTDIPDFKIPF